MSNTRKAKRDPFVFLEWVENRAYHGASYRTSDVPRVLGNLKHRIESGSVVGPVYIDNKDTPNWRELITKR